MRKRIFLDCKLMQPPHDILQESGLEAFILLAGNMFRLPSAKGSSYRQVPKWVVSLLIQEEAGKTMEDTRAKSSAEMCQIVKQK